MKAFLLAAGEGTRLRPITNHMPKCLVPINGKPLLEIWYRILENYQIDEILVNTHHLSEQVNLFLKTFQTPIKSKIFYESALLGSAGTLLANRRFVEDEPFFWIIYADSFTTINLQNILSFHLQKKSSLLTMTLYHTAVPKESGIVTVNHEGCITDFQEKPQDPSSNLANAGIMVASSKLIDEIPDKVPCDLSLDVLPKLVGRMYGKVIDDYFIDIGTPENYRIAQIQYQKLKNDFPFLQ